MKLMAPSFLLMAFALSGCTATIGNEGPPGPPGLAGPAGAPGPVGPPGPRGAQLARPLFVADNDPASVNVDADTDVIVSQRQNALTIVLPRPLETGRLITVRTAGSGIVVVRTLAGSRIERSETLVLPQGEMATFMADGQNTWIAISNSDID